MVLPAHAGMIPIGWPTSRDSSSAPRTRGDDPYLDNNGAVTHDRYGKSVNME
jgi:hypothetical protein